MLETPKERIKLLKAGITGKQIEELYILYNNFKVVGYQRPIKKIAINTTINKNIAIYQEATVDFINKNRKAVGLSCPTHAWWQLNENKGEQVGEWLVNSQKFSLPFESIYVFIQSNINDNF